MAMLRPLLMDADGDLTRHWLAFLSLEDLKTLSSASRRTAASPLRRVLVARGVWRLPYPPQWRRADDDATHTKMQATPALDWADYEAQTYLHAMDASLKQHIRRVAVPRSALLAEVGARLPGVTHVYTWHFDGDVAGIHKISALQRRQLYHQLRQIDPRDLERFRGSPHLHELALRNARLGRRLPQLAAFKQLRSLDLADADVNRDFTDFTCLAQLTQLRSLNLERTGLSDLAFLDALTQLETLRIGGAALVSLDGLQRVATLTTLDISNVWLEDEAVDLTALTKLRALRAELLGSMNPLDIQLDAPTLATCSFRYCWLQHRHFLTKCPLLESLDLRDTILFDESPAPRLARLETMFLSSNPAAIRSFDWPETTQLRSLHLSTWDPAFVDADLIEGAFLASLPQLQTLEIAKLSKYDQMPTQPPSVASLTIHQVEVGDEALIQQLLANNTKLTTLRLAAGRAVTLTLPSLSKPEQLRELQLTNVTLANLDAVAQLSGLQSLEISGFGTIPSAASLSVLAFLPRLKSLKICQNSAFDDVTPLLVLRHLEVLSVRHTSVKDVGALAAMATLRELELGFIPIVDVSALHSLARLQRVVLPGNVDCGIFHDADAFPLLRSVVHELVGGAQDCLLAGHDAIAPW